ncbi:glycosyltransferase family 1 protein [Geodermatophilus telluris]|uniref:glycosyltransferase family 1 protein n=1 Tax=Geodermatophilus telluris TaxID=1190417 RepID=UPI00111398A3|nr:glycosyltransferase family 1 protein [Geodermatophilus telluris]
MTVFLSSVRWGYLWQRHHSLAAAAATSADVVFVESQPRRLRQLVLTPLSRLRGQRQHAVPSSVPRGVRLVAPSPLAVLFPRAWARVLAERILARSGGRPVDVVVYVPSTAYLEVARRLAERGARVVYDAVVSWAEAPRSFHPPKAVLSAEGAMPAHWRVVSDNPVVADGLSRRLGRPVAVVPPAVDDPFLAHDWTPLAQREEVIGWFGALHREVDVDLLCAAARAGLRVETVGPVEDPAVGRQLADAGVTLLPAVSIEDLPRRISHWRVALLAYRGPRVGSITPAKLLNALAGFRVAVRGIPVSEQLADRVVRLPEDDALAVATLRVLVSSPDEVDPLPYDEHSWSTRLRAITGRCA